MPRVYVPGKTAFGLMSLAWAGIEKYVLQENRINKKDDKHTRKNKQMNEKSINTLNNVHEI